MASTSTILAALKYGRCSSTVEVEVRLLRFWEARNIKRGGHLMGVDMLLLDSKVIPFFKFMFIIVLNRSPILRFMFNSIMISILFISSSWFGFESSFKLCSSVYKRFQAMLIPATINVNRLPTYRGHLKVGSMFSLSDFDVTRCNQNFRLSDSPLLIRFTLCILQISPSDVSIQMIVNACRYPLQDRLGYCYTSCKSSTNLEFRRFLTRAIKSRRFHRVARSTKYVFDIRK